MSQTFYELNPSQQVVKLQCTYTLFKRVINIISSVSTTREIDLDLMKKALNLAVKRNDCLRIRFLKHGKKLMQYFADECVYEDVPYIEFKTQKEFDDFILKIRKKPIAYKKGEVFEPYFCKMPDGKFMLLTKVCHMILDLYGLNFVYNDIFNIYDALKEGVDFPPEPAKFEDVVKRDLAQQDNEALQQKNREFFQEYLNSRDEPYYAGLHGKNLPLWQKLLKKGRRAMKMFFIKCDTEGVMHPISSTTMEKVLKYCEEKNCSVSNFLFYTMSICCSRINGNVENMLPLELCNCRGTRTEKNCAGTKVQSVACYTTVDHEKSFEHSFEDFCKEQTQLYRYINFSDQEFEMMLHKTYKSSMMSTYYNFTYSFIPFKNQKDIDFQVYSNGKGSLISYVAQMWDIETNEVKMAYDCQTKVLSKEDVKAFHEKYMSVISQVLENNYIRIKEINV